MKVLGLDIATYDSGWSVVDQNTNKVIDYGVVSIPKSEKDFTKRLALMSKEFQKVMQNVEFEHVVLSMAPVFNRNMDVVTKIKIAEGTIIGMCLANNKTFNIISDASWMQFLRKPGEGSLERKTKKERAVSIFVKLLGKDIESQKWKGSDKLITTTTDGEIILDDPADATLTALLEKRVRDKMFEENILDQKLELRKKLRSENTKLRSSITREQNNISGWKLEVTQFKNIYEYTGSKVKLNQQLNREEKISIAQQNIIILEEKIERNNQKIKGLSN